VAKILHGLSKSLAATLVTKQAKYNLWHYPVVSAVIMGLCQTKLVAAPQKELLFDEFFRGLNPWALSLSMNVI
jgi:hypothetical protein